MLLAAAANAWGDDQSLPDLYGGAYPGLSVAEAPAVTEEVKPVPLPGRPLTLLQLTDVALRNNPSTRAAWAQVRVLAAQVGIANAAYWPNISATLSASRSQRQSQTDASNTGPLQNRYGPGITFSYLLWDFGARAGARDAARYRLLGARLSRTQVLQDVIRTVEQDYYQLQGYQALVDADRKTLDNANASLDAANKRRSVGLATVGDVYQAEAAVAQAQLALQQARTDEAVARGNLAAAAGYPVNAPLRIVSWREPVRAAKLPASAAELLARARRMRPELLAAKAQELAAAANVRAVRGQGLPTLTLDGSGSRTSVVNGGSGNSYALTATINIPLFSGLRDRYALHEARAQVDQAQANTDELRSQVEQEVWQAYQNVDAADSKLTSAQALLKSATLAAKVARARYQVGLDSILDLLSAQATLANARASRVQTELDYFSALSALSHAAGGLPAQASQRVEQ